MSVEQCFLVRFWGVRGSYPTPGAGTIRHGGNTSCVEIQVGEGEGHTLIFDAGSGIIRLGDALLEHREPQARLHAALFITHGHGDHLVGFPFFAPLFDPQTSLHVFGPQLLDYSIEQLVTQVMSPPYFPVDVRTLPSRRSYHTIVDEQCIIWNGTHKERNERNEHNTYNEPYIGMLPHRAKRNEVCVVAKFTECHPKDGAVMYRIEYAGRRVVYATDVEWPQGCDQDVLAFIDGADLLIHDAQYTEHEYVHMKQGFGHSTIEMAVATAQAAHVRELVLFHHDPTYDDIQLDRMEAEAREAFPHSYSAYESMEIDILKHKQRSE